MAQSIDDHSIGDARSIPDEELERILSVTGVLHHRKAVRESIKTTADMALDRFSHERRRITRSERATIKLVANLSDELSEAISRLDGGLDPRLALWFWNWAVRNDDDDDFSLYDLQDRLDALAESCRELTAPPKKKAPNRPAGSVQYPVLRMLVVNLYGAIVIIGGGKLTLSQSVRSGDATGLLPAVLKILRRHLPEVVPARLPPYPTMRRIIREAADRDGGLLARPPPSKL
jgi:hypothetical protein